MLRIDNIKYTYKCLAMIVRSEAKTVLAALG